MYIQQLYKLCTILIKIGILNVCMNLIIGIALPMTKICYSFIYFLEILFKCLYIIVYTKNQWIYKWQSWKIKKKLQYICTCNLIFFPKNLLKIRPEMLHHDSCSAIFTSRCTGLPLLWNQREKWLLFQVLTKEKWETTGRSGESTGRSQNISLIVPLFTFMGHYRGIRML